MYPPTNTSSSNLALHPTIFVIFGITGDLASRKLIPALLALYARKMLPPRFAVIGFSRRSFSREEFRELIRSKLNIKQGQFKEEDIKHFFDCMSYEQGTFDDPASYNRLAERLSEIDMRWGQCSNKLFHLSVPPDLYENILVRLAESKLNIPCADGVGWTRVLIEKPFGHDIETARSLDKLLSKLFKEEQIFRIDHYLAKEALQNILAFRFANAMFEPIWNHEYIEKVHIKLFEKNGMEGRGAFYEQVGALRDVGQNHMLVMLSLIAMNMPKSFTATAIHRKREKALNAIKTITPRGLGRSVVRAQYDGYTAESGVSPQSEVETYFRVKVELTSSRWKGVSFYLESGKAVAETKTEIDIYFKGNNILTFRIQPDEGIKIKFFVKTPGYEWQTEPKTLKFKYSDVSSFTNIPSDYEKLIHDAFIGDQTLFASTDEIMACWRFVTPIIKSWGKVPLVKYEKGAKEVL